VLCREALREKGNAAVDENQNTGCDDLIRGRREACGVVRETRKTARRESLRKQGVASR